MSVSWDRFKSCLSLNVSGSRSFTKVATAIRCSASRNEPLDPLPLIQFSIRTNLTTMKSPRCTVDVGTKCPPLREMHFDTFEIRISELKSCLTKWLSGQVYNLLPPLYFSGKTLLKTGMVRYNSGASKG